MSNLQNFNNIYADLAESAYNNRPTNFPPKANSKTWTKRDFSQNITDPKTGEVLTTGGQNLPNNGVVYLQPDLALHTEEVKTDLTVPNENGGYYTESYTTSTYQKGLFTDEKTGFNAYFVTDTPDPKEAKQAYFAIRGSDSYTDSHDLETDWLGNNLPFAVGNDEIPQARDAEQAMQGAIKELPSGALLNITGHSLGTMVAVQGAAQLIKDKSSAINAIGNIVLFDGPDCTQSLKNMGLSSEQIKALSDKTTYFVNPLDLVSMLNRTAPLKDQFGQVHFIVPVDFGGTLDAISAHDFGEFQLDTNGNPLVASRTFHPELLDAGTKLAKLEEEALSKLKSLGLSDSVATTLFNLAIRGGAIDRGAAGYAVILQFQADYARLISDTREKSKQWDEKAVSGLQSQIGSASGGQKVSLRNELLETVAQDAELSAQDYVAKVKSILSDSKDKVQKAVSDGREAAYNVAYYLDSYEVEALLADFQMQTFWDEGIESETNKAAHGFQTSLEQFSDTLRAISQRIQETDREGAAGFNNLLAATQKNRGN